MPRMHEESSNRPAWLRDILSSEHVFKFLTFAYALPLFGCGYGLIKLISDDPQTFRDFGVLVAVVCAFCGGMLAHLTLQKLGAADPMNTKRQRILLGVGFGAAFVLALALSLYNHNDTGMASRRQENGRAEREARGRMEQDPNVRRGAELLNQNRR
jgi:hypothetical protein